MCNKQRVKRIRYDSCVKTKESLAGRKRNHTWESCGKLIREKNYMWKNHHTWKRTNRVFIARENKWQKELTWKMIRVLESETKANESHLRIVSGKKWIVSGKDVWRNMNHVSLSRVQKNPRICKKICERSSNYCTCEK